MNEPLIEGSKVLTGENLRVLAEDLEQCLQEIESVLAEPRQHGNAVQKAAKSIAMAQDILDDLKTQGKQGCRQDRVACDMLIKSYQKKLESLEKNRQAAEAMAGKGTKELSAHERKKAAEAALDRACNIQRDTQESVQRSIGIIQDAQASGSEAAVVIKGQTEQLKSIYADYTSLEEELSKANQTLVKVPPSLQRLSVSSPDPASLQMARRAITDKVTMVLLFLIVIAIGG
ncbi:hypothetical protein GUITHDRAFT_116923 [Guillardia theta CCMP2712]|uniref:Uncharacterized protein n=1 Tax=Guillardia theta (strain CCMP2712) TaxID=905079 RepID=L1IM85_GUITC|nr:hypothetical protein GUITHDRAFT_116923 [Guillardia theta CCMP2712]EKX36900.1 hypothetical protein GUITHDRAFT_116923 [Guillardia theta CCMP2712]|eukprot:XP_005823880.1 hypothetical protein GUITHDRAFT_116923 [Guillardia theta CCMP2712]